MRRTFGALLFLFAATTTPPALAQPSPAPSALPEIGRVVTSDRHDEPLAHTSRPTFVVDRASMLARGARTVADALGAVPGVELYRYGAFGSQSNYGIRGSTSAQTLVLVDGEPIAPASSDAIDLGTLSTVGVSRIEVVESGASTLYGASAVGGVINIITGIPRGTYLALASGTLGDRELRTSIGTQRVGVSFERHIASNVYAFPGIDGVVAGIRTNADAQQSAARLSYADHFSGNVDVRASAGTDAVIIGVPGGEPAAGAQSFLTPNARQHTAREDLRLSVSRGLRNSTITLSTAFSRQNLVYVDPQSGGESDAYDGRAQLSLRDSVQSATSTLLTGIDLLRETAALSPVGLSAALSQAAAYAQFEQAIGPAVRLNAGLRGEHDAPYGSMLAPSLGAVVNIARLRFAANINESFRGPTIVDLYYPHYSNADLKPEKLRNADVTIGSDAVLGGATLGYFNRQANNLIVLGANGPENRTHACLAGLMATLRTRPFHHVVASLSATNLYRAIDTSGGAMNGARLPFTPVFQTTLELARPIGGSAAGFSLDVTTLGGHQENYAPRPVSGFSSVDASLQLRLAPQAVLSIRGHNIGNERYAPVYGYPAPGRRLDVELATQ